MRKAELKLEEEAKKEERVAKDLKSELILQIFREEEEKEGPEQDPSMISMNRLNIKIKASETTSKLL